MKEDRLNTLIVACRSLSILVIERAKIKLYLWTSRRTIATGPVNEQ